MKYNRTKGVAEVVEAELDEFLKDLPYILSNKDKLIPPIEVLNQIFQEGIINSGMSGIYEWVPFVIAFDEYNVVLNSLISDGYKSIIMPKWVKTKDDWYVWRNEYIHKIPAKEHQFLIDKEKKTLELYKKSLSVSDENEINKQKENHIQAQIHLADFLNSFSGV